MRGVGPITKKERQILEMLAMYYTYEAIGKMMNRSITTVYCHIASIMNKTDIHKKEHLIQYAQEQGYGRRIPA